MAPEQPGWAGTPFAGLATVHGISSAGDALVTVALAGSVFVSVSLDAARGRTALGLLCTVLPFAVVGPFVGPLIDRMPGGRKFVVFTAAIGRMAACLMMSSWIHSLLLFPAAFLSLVCSRTHAVARASLVPGVVDTHQDLVRANARLAMGSAVFTSVAAGIGSLVYKLLGSHVLLDMDAILFAAEAGLSLHLLRGVREPLVEAQPRRPTGGGPARSPLIGRHARRYQARAARPATPRPVALALVAMAGMRASAGFLTALVVFGFRRQGAPIVWYGLVAVASVGANFGGALLAPPLRDRVSEKRLVVGAALVIGAVAVGTTQMAALQRRPAALLLAATIGLSASVAKAAFDATVQRRVPDADRGRSFARFESIFQLVWVLGALVPVLVALPLLAGFVVVALVVLITSAFFVAGLARDRQQHARSFPGGDPAAPPAWPAPAPSPDS